jgi:hypothetical protein
MCSWTSRQLFTNTIVHKNWAPRPILSQLNTWLSLFGTWQVHYSSHTSPKLAHFLSQFNPVDIITAIYLVCVNTMLRSTPRVSKWSLLLKFSNQNSVPHRYDNTRKLFSIFMCYWSSRQLFINTCTKTSHYTPIWFNWIPDIKHINMHSENIKHPTPYHDPVQCVQRSVETTYFALPHIF